MIISKDKVVSLSYELKASGVEGVVENVNKDKPMTFIFGSGYLMKEFENNIDGLKVDDSFEFTLMSDEAYGPVNKEAIVDLPRNLFVADGKPADHLLVVGNVIPMSDTSGRRMDGIVLEVNEETVKMDFNHPMAGKDLSFKGSVVEIREATKEELEHGHIHNSNCGSCHDTCEDPENCN